MPETAQQFSSSESSRSTPNSCKSNSRIAVDELKYYAEDWVADGEYRLHSPRTIEARRNFARNLLWFLNHRGCEYCGTTELRQFFVYLLNGHEEPEGRWGRAWLNKPVRPITLKDYYINLKIMFDWLVAEGTVESSPMDKVSRPIVRAEQVQPFSPEHITALLRAARQSVHPQRDEAILLFLLDTGLRASELCNLRCEEVDFVQRRCIVLGKGNKHRTVYFGRKTARALSRYLRNRKSGVVFLSDRGMDAGQPLTRSGLLQLVSRLGEAEKLQAVRCSPHTFRHTFAVEFLRAGGNVFSLKELLGHSSLHMTNRYVSVAQADIQNQHRQFSPVDRIRGAR